MAYTYDPLFAADPNNPAVVASNAAILIYDPADTGKAPLDITDSSGSPLANPITVNKSGFGPAFQHPTIDRVAWQGGGFEGFFTSYEGLKNAALDAAAAANLSAGEAATAAADAGAAVTASLSAAVADAEAAQAAATAAANLVGAPADSAIATAINAAGSATKTALSATIVTQTSPLYVPSALAFVPIQHGADADFPRTAGPGARLWVGSVFPNNLVEGVDLYAAPADVAPPAPPTIDTTNLVARFAARALNLSAGAAVTAWPVLEGSAGGGFTVAGAPAYRTAGSIQYVETDGVDDALSFVSARSQPSTTVIVARTFSLTSGLTLFGSTSGSTALSTIGVTSGNFVAYAGSNLTGPAADYGWHVFSVVYNGASSVFRIDGVQVATGNPGSNTSGGIRHGANSTLATFSRVGVCESIHYSGVKDNTALAALEATLMSAYGIS